MHLAKQCSSAMQTLYGETYDIEKAGKKKKFKHIKHFTNNAYNVPSMCYLHVTPSCTTATKLQEIYKGVCSDTMTHQLTSKELVSLTYMVTQVDIKRVC